MPILDEKGRLFGKINVIDLAIVVLVAVILAAALRFTLSQGEPATVHAQVVMEDVPPDLAASIDAGTTFASGVTVTDVRKVPQTGGSKTVYAKVRLDVVEDQQGFRFGQDRLTPGATITLPIAGARLPATVVLVDDSPDLRFLTPPTDRLFVARGVSPGTAHLAANASIGTFGSGAILQVRDRAVVPTAPGKMDLFVVGEQFRLTRQGKGGDVTAGRVVELQLGGTTVEGQLHPGPDADEVEVGRTRVGTVVQLDRHDPPATGTEDQGSTAVPGVPRTPLPTLSVGVRETVAGRTVAEIVGFTLQGGPVANDVDTDPFQARVSLDLLTVRVGGTIEYKGHPLVPGSTVVFRGPDAVFTATVTRVGAAPPTTNRTVTFEVPRTPPSVAEEIDVGDRETTGVGSPLLTVRNVTAEPATVTLATSDGRLRTAEHPRLLDLTVTAEIRVRGDGTFKGRPVHVGADVLIAPDGIPLETTIREVS